MRRCEDEKMRYRPPLFEPCAQTLSGKRVRKWNCLKSKVIPPEGVQFWSFFDPFIVANLLRCEFQVQADLTSNSCGWNLELGRSIFARLLFFTFLRSKKRPLLVTLFCSNFHSLEALEVCLEGWTDVFFCSNFHVLATLEFKTCIVKVL